MKDPREWHGAASGKSQALGIRERLCPRGGGHGAVPKGSEHGLRLGSIGTLFSAIGFGFLGGSAQSQGLYSVVLVDQLRIF